MTEAVISGAGLVPPWRGSAEYPVMTARRAIEGSLVDAGLSRTDVDGIFTFRHSPHDPVAKDLQRALGIHELAAWADIESSGPSGMAAVLAAVQAIESGACRAAVAFKAAVHYPRTSGQPTADPTVAPTAEQQLIQPYGLGSITLASVAMRMRRRSHEFGTDPMELVHVAVNARRWAGANDAAVLRAPLSRDDYASGRMIVDPVRLYDCDYPVNGAGAVVVTGGDVVEGRGRPAVVVDAMSASMGAGDGWVFADDFLYGGTRSCAARLWERASFGADEVDLIEAYDGFSYFAAAWVEALGVCPPGTFGKWVEGGDRIAPGGGLPMNTSGGQLAQGRLHSFGLLHEAVLQLRGECGSRQVPGAATAVVTAGFGPQCAALALRRS